VKKLGFGKGPSIKAAEQAAAKSALDSLQQSVEEKQGSKKD